MTLSHIVLIVYLAATTSIAAASNNGYWYQFRGPNGDGKSTCMNLPVEFDEAKHVRWKTAIPNEGWSSPVVWGDKIWITSGSDEKCELRAICVSLDNGKILHNIKVFAYINTPMVEAYKSRYQYNSPASPTPVVEQGRVYVHFGSQGTACLDTKSGKKLWERRDLHCDQIQYGGSSPIVDQKSLFVAFDGIDKQFFIALDKETGETRWKQDRNVNSDWEATLRSSGEDPSGIMASKPNDNKKAFATAHIIEYEDRRQLVAPGGEAIISYDPKTGEEFWRILYLGHYNVAARPLFENGLLFLNVTGPGELLLAIRPDGTGDVTNSHVVWSTRKGVPNISSPIIIDDALFFISENGIVRCLGAGTGEEIWKKRIGGTYWASPSYANGRIYFFSRQGEVVIITVSKVTAEANVIARNKMDAKFIASPAVAGNFLILRSTTHLYCLAQPPGEN
jgi:outer membrane protein assembly factor BamB